MKRLALYAGILGVLGITSIAVADLAVETDEERIDGMLHEVARSRGKAEAILRHVDLSAVPLEVSVGHHEERFGQDDFDELVSRAEDLDGALGARPLEVRQREIEIRGTEAKVIANLVAEDAPEDLVPCDIELHRAGDRWLVQRVRVMR
jgi:hypothetical protein